MEYSPRIMVLKGAADSKSTVCKCCVYTCTLDLSELERNVLQHKCKLVLPHLLFSFPVTLPHFKHKSDCFRCHVVYL